jgi:Domain of unknown function (DUF4157)
LKSVQYKTVNRAATVQKNTQKPAAATPGVQRKAVAAKGAVQLSAMKVSSPKDPAEKEADSTAKKIMRMAVPESSIKLSGSGGIFRQVKQEEKDKKVQTKLRSPYINRFANSGIFAQRHSENIIQRKSEGQPDVESNVAADIQSSQSTGAPLPLTVRRFMEPRFQANFSNVKIHTGDKSAQLNRQLNAQAFTTGNQIFFGKNKFQPETAEGKELIAHELTHTIQQGEVVQRSEDVTVTQQSPVQVQRLGISDALDYFADKANLIPGFRMFTIILGVNPINMSTVDRSAANILRAIVEFLPGGGLITQALDNHGVFEKVGAWVEQQIKTLGMVGSSIKQAISTFLDSLGWRDIFDLGGVWTRAKRIFTEPIDKIISFGKSLVTGIIQFVKDAILKPLAKLAEGTEGYNMLKMLLGEDPVTGEPVAFNADVLIGGFMKLIGQEEIWNNLKKANGVARAIAWFNSAKVNLLGFVRQIPSLFISAFKALEIMDIVLVPRAFGKLVSVFGSFVGKFITWAGNAVWNLLEIIFDVVSPGAFGYIKRTGAALKSILKNPLPFVGNLVKAAKLGFQNFSDNIGGHLKAGLIDWLTGSLTGVYIPKALSLIEMGKFALSVLGITWAGIRGKIVKVLGANGEAIMAGLEKGFDVIVALINGGPAAAWETIQQYLTDMKDMVVSGITDFVVDTIVKKAIPKLIAMFIPGAGFISAIISIYDTVMVFVQKISKIIQVVTGFIDSIVAIAGGAIGAAARRVEGILSGLLSLAISFLAGFLGLGKVTDKIMVVIEKVRTKVDKAIDTVINAILSKAKSLFARLFGKKDGKPEERTQEQKKIDLAKGIADAQKLLEDKSLTSEQIKKQLPGIKSKYKITIFELVTDAKSETKETDHIHGEIHSTPVKDDSKTVEKENAMTVVIAVISTKQPRSSTILTPSIPPLRTAQTSPGHFELDSTKAIAQATGLPVEPDARFIAKEKSSGIFTFSAPAGFTASPSGLLLPTTPRLFGSLSGDPRQRDREESRFEVRGGGDLRKKGMSRHPDALLVTPQQVEPLEFTLDASMNIRESQTAIPHKLLQIPGTIEVILRNFPRQTPVVYNVFVRGSVPQLRIDELNRAIKTIGGNIDVTVNFVKR